MNLNSKWSLFLCTRALFDVNGLDVWSYLLMPISIDAFLCAIFTASFLSDWPNVELTNLGAIREASVIRFSGAPSLGPEAIVSVSPLGTSLTIPLIHPGDVRLFAMNDIRFNGNRQTVLTVDRQQKLNAGLEPRSRSAEKVETRESTRRNSAYAWQPV